MASSTKQKAAVDIKAALEAFAGHEIEASKEQIEQRLRFFVFPFSTYSFTPAATGATSTDNTGQVVARSIISFVPPICYTSELLDVSGFSSMPDSGHLTLLVTGFLCSKETARIYNEPVNIVATAVSASPVFLTATHTLITSPTLNVVTDVQIDIYAWDNTGAPVGNVPVNWRCRVPTELLIIIQ